MHAVGEEPVGLVHAAGRERQHGHGRVPGRGGLGDVHGRGGADPCFGRGGRIRRLRDFGRHLGPPGAVEDRPLAHEYAHGQHDQHDDHHVELAPGVVGDALAAVDLGLPLDPLGRYLVGPGEHQHRHEADGDERHDERQHPVGRIEGISRQIDDLGEQPAGHHVGHAHADDVPALEFLEETHGLASAISCSQRGSSWRDSRKGSSRSSLRDGATRLSLASASTPRARSSRPASA